jgi:hypothetical protein
MSRIRINNNSNHIRFLNWCRRCKTKFLTNNNPLIPKNSSRYIHNHKYNRIYHNSLLCMSSNKSFNHHLQTVKWMVYSLLLLIHRIKWHRKDQVVESLNKLLTNLLIKWILTSISLLLHMHSNLLTMHLMVNMVTNQISISNTNNLITNNHLLMAHSTNKCPNMDIKHQ